MLTNKFATRTGATKGGHMLIGLSSFQETSLSCTSLDVYEELYVPTH